MSDQVADTADLPDDATPPAPADEGAPPATPDAPADDAEVAKWKAMARKHEKEAKANSAELAKIRSANLSDTEKAIEDAKAAGKAEASTEFGSLLAAARIEAALTGIVPNPAAIVEDLNLAKYLTDTGEVDAEKVTALRAKYTAFAKPGTPAGSADGGAQGGAKPGQLSRADLKSMSPQEITEAKADGRLDDILGVSK